MSTKTNPGAFDCFANAGPDEEMFILLARDPVAPYLVEIWAALRSGDLFLARRLLAMCYERMDRKPTPPDQLMEAMQCATRMHQWRIAKLNEAAPRSAQQLCQCGQATIDVCDRVCGAIGGETWTQR